MTQTTYRPILDRHTHAYESQADVWYIRITPGRPVLPPVPDERWASDFPAPDPQTIAELRQAGGNTMKAEIDAIGYVRFSPRADAETSQSNEAQAQRIEEYAADKGYRLLHIYPDKALTGMDDERNPDAEVAVAKRPSLVEALDAVRPGMVFLVRWRSRIAREPYIQEYVERIVAWQGGILEATDESNETGLGPDLERGVRAIMDRDYVRKIRWMTKRAMKKHQTEGRRMGRIDRVPFGFRADLTSAPNSRGNPGLIVPDADEQETLRLIHQAAGRGLTPRAICRHLDGLGRSRRGKCWVGAASVVSGILRRNGKS